MTGNLHVRAGQYIAGASGDGLCELHSKRAACGNEYAAFNDRVIGAAIGCASGLNGCTSRVDAPTGRDDIGVIAPDLNLQRRDRGVDDYRATQSHFDARRRKLRVELQRRAHPIGAAGFQVERQIVIDATARDAGQRRVGFWERLIETLQRAGEAGDAAFFVADKGLRVGGGGVGHVVLCGVSR